MHKLLLTALLSASLLAACDQNQQAGNTPPAAILPAGLFIDAEPAEARPVAEVKKTAREGDRVVVRGRIGGTIHPFVDGRAVMTIVDMQLPTCADNPADSCKTPWDYCCETREDITANAATVQVTAESGGPLRANLKGVHGLEPMTEVVVVGTVGKTSSPTAFLINAESIYVKN